MNEEDKRYSNIKSSDFDEQDEYKKAGIIQNKLRKSYNDDLGELTCVVMVAMEVDAHGDMFTIECVKKAYEEYTTDYAPYHGTQHSGNEVEARMVSHWYTEDGGLFDGVEAPPYSFIAKFKIEDEELRKDYRQNKKTGVSIEAKGTTIKYSTLEEKGYSINDIANLTKSQNQEQEKKPKRIILKAKVNKIDFVDFGANNRIGLYKSIDTPAPEVEEIEKAFDDANDISENQDLAPSAKYSIAKNIKLKKLRGEKYGIVSLGGYGIYDEYIEVYNLESYLDPVNLRYQIVTEEQLINFLKYEIDYFHYQYEYHSENDENKIKSLNSKKVIVDRLLNFLINNDYGVSYDYVLERIEKIEVYSNEELYNKFEEKYKKENSMDEALKKSVAELVTEILAQKDEQRKIEQQREIELAKAKELQEASDKEKETLKSDIEELKKKLAELQTKKPEQEVQESEVQKSKDTEESIEVKIAKAVDEKLKEAVTRLTSNSATDEVQKSKEKKSVMTPSIKNVVGPGASIFENF